jgi:hypothetical protein
VRERKGVGRANRNEDDGWKQPGGTIRCGQPSGRDGSGRRSRDLDAAEMDDAVDRTRLRMLV